MEEPCPQTSVTPPGWEEHDAGLRRCLACTRWGGTRISLFPRNAIAFDPSTPLGPCVDGPWNGSLRGPRNACGRWLKWLELPPDPEP